MGATNSTLEEDKGLELCRARKKFIKQALNGRCSLAAAHITYVEELKLIGTALRRFVEVDAQTEPFILPTRSATPHPLTERSASQFSISSRSLGQHVDADIHTSPSPSPIVSTRFQSHHMKFKSVFSKKVEEKPSTPITVSVISNTPPSTTPRSTEAPDVSFETAPIPSDTPPWDYFGLFHPIDDHFSHQETRGYDHSFEYSGDAKNRREEEGVPEYSGDAKNLREEEGVPEYSEDFKNLREEEGVPNMEDIQDKILNAGTEESEESEDEFDEPPTATLVRSFTNLNAAIENLDNGNSWESSLDSRPETKIPTSMNVNEAKEKSLDSESHIRSSQTEILEMNGKKRNSPILSPLRATSSRFVHLEDVKKTPMKETEDAHIRSSQTEILEMNGKKGNSPMLSPLRATSSRFVHSEDVKITPMKETEDEDVNITPRKETEVQEKVVAPKDFFSSMKDIERLFIKASDSGKEVPRMLEANKFHFRPVVPGRERGIGPSLLRSCFSCGEDPSEIKQELEQNSVKYLTWHRTTSSRSASSRNLLGGRSIEEVEDAGNILFDSFCMNSGSHASTLDRLYAWEKKLYDEVKAGQILKSSFDQKCRLLRQQESRGEHTDKTRAVVKDLHTRIRVALHRIDSISKKVEDIRDQELQPQLEELIKGLRRMWEMMLECHKLQFHIISVSHAPGNTKITMQSDIRRQVTIHLGHELNSFLSSFTKWTGAQKLYLDAIDKWLFKCVSLPQKKTKRNKRMKPPPIRNCGPPIYMICGAWVEMIDELPSKAVIDSAKDLAAEVAHFIPSQDKSQGKAGKHSLGDSNASLLNEASEDWIPALDRFRTSLAGFLGQLNNFAEASVLKFTELQRAIEESKSNYEQFKSQK